MIEPRGRSTTEAAAGDRTCGGQLIGVASRHDDKHSDRSDGHYSTREAQQPHDAKHTLKRRDGGTCEGQQAWVEGAPLAQGKYKRRPISQLQEASSSHSRHGNGCGCEEDASVDGSHG